MRPGRHLRAVSEAARAAGVSVPVEAHASAILEVLDNLRFAPGNEPPIVPDDFLEMAGVVSLGGLDASAADSHAGVVLWNANGSQKDSGGQALRALSLVKVTPDRSGVVPIGDYSIGRVLPTSNELDLSFARPVPPRPTLRRDSRTIIIATFQPARGRD